MRAFILFCLLITCAFVHAQVTSSSDTTVHVHALDSVTIVTSLRESSVKPLPPVQGTYFFGGKKTEVISLAHSEANLTDKTARQVFAKVPGVFVYDMDGAGNQVNIASRGLDPHRGWEFNIRKDDIITNSDMYGYPASHYSMPLESIDRIEIVRGTGSLQYGAQFGGMLNYVSKEADTSRAFTLESINTIGSYNLLSTYNAVHGKVGRFRYYAYVSKKSRAGYRANEHTDAEAERVALRYDPANNLSIELDWSRSTYLYRLPGPLTDQQFAQNPRQGTRGRNYFSPDIHVPSVKIDWTIGGSTKVQLNTSALLGRRNSVLFDKPTNVADTVNLLTGSYNNRQVDIDRFNSYTAELRVLQQYRAGRQLHTLAAGVQYMNNDLHRTQLGKGTTGTDYDLTLAEPAWGRDLHFKTKNIAVFVENNIRFTQKFSINLGGRLESGRSNMTGTMTYYPGNEVPLAIPHKFPLLGVSFSYIPASDFEWYGGWSQAYHPMVFKDLIPASLYEKVDPSIRDAHGYNAEIGLRGNWRFLRWDATAFLLRINDRFGTVSGTDASGTFYTYRTNIGNSLNKGLELLLQGDWMLTGKLGLSVFTATAFAHARYTSGLIRNGDKNIPVAGNRVESAPDLITRNGLTVRFEGMSCGILYSYTAKSFADALNTVEPPAATGAVGLVPSYGLFDLQASARLSRAVQLRGSISNLANRSYFTKRPSFYPGPGIWPSEGRSAAVTIALTL